VILAALLFAAGVAQQPPPTRIVSEGQEYEVARSTGYRFTPIDAAALKAAFAGIEPLVFDGMRFFLVMQDMPHSEDFREYESHIRFAIEYGNGKAYRLGDGDTEWIAVTRGRHEEKSTPQIRRVSRGTYRLDFQESTSGAHSTATTDSAAIILTGNEPRVAARIACTWVEMGGACTAPAWLFGTPKEAFDCSWNETRRDFICNATREWTELLWSTHPAERNFTLLSGEELPVVRPGIPSYTSMHDLAKTLRQPGHLPGRRVIVQGTGLLQYVETGAIGNPQTQFYVAPGLTDDMTAAVGLYGGRQDHRSPHAENQRRS
jgi:hypothetical protein